MMRHLVQLFATHLSDVVCGMGIEQNTALKAIKQWLQANSGWLLVIEDASWLTTALWECIPSTGTGRVLITSKDPLHLPTITGQRALRVIHSILISPFESAASSIELLQAMNLFNKKLPDNSPVDEGVLANECLGTAGAVTWEPAPAGSEKNQKCRERLHRVQVALLQHQQLSSSQLANFLDNSLGHLPLSVALCGNMFRADSSLKTVADLINLFEAVPLDQVDRSGRNPENDTHYLGLARSVQIAVERIQQASELDCAEKQRALGLLTVLAVMPRAETPRLLFEGTDSDALATLVLGEEAAGNAQYTELLKIFEGGSEMSNAVEELQKYGLLQPGTGSCIGVVHQLVQRSIQESSLVPAMAGAERSDISMTICALRHVLNAKSKMKDSKDTRHWDTMRAMVPCLAAWRKLLCIEAQPTKTCLMVSMEEADGYILANYASFVQTQGQYQEALQLRQEVLEFRKRVLPEDHPDIARSMHNLAASLSNLGEHQEAMQLQREVLEFNKRVLPEDHPDIAASMHNLAISLGDLGEHQEALQIARDALEFRKRMLPERYPDIANSMHCLVHSLNDLGEHQEALHLTREVLEFRKRVLPEDHPDIATSMGNLATSLSDLGEHQEALQLRREVLEFRKRVLPEDHLDIATSMNNLANSLNDLGEHQEALQLDQELLEFRKRVLPKGHPDIAKSELLCNLVQSKLRSQPKPPWASFDEGFSQMLKDKAAGTSLFKQGDLAEAVAKYQQALSYAARFGPLSPQEAQQLRDTQLSLHLNSSLVLTKIEDWNAVKHHCDSALSFDEDSVKALFRRAGAHHALADYALAEADLKRAILLEPADPSVTNLLKRVRKGRAKQLKQEQNACRKMFG